MGFGLYFNRRNSQGLYTFSAFTKNMDILSELAEPLILDVSERKIE